jgi:two-component system phosphate regulon response regulator PhoB
MSVIHVLTTDPIGSTFQDLVLENKAFTFDVMDETGLPGPLDGPVWAFIDWVLPGLSGLELCRRLKTDARTKDAHITMVLESDNGESRRQLLEARVEDYILGPITYEKVRDKIVAQNALQQRQHRYRVIEAGDFTIDLGAHLARYNGEPIKVGPSQFRLLRFLIENPDLVLTREEVIEALSRQGTMLNSRTVDKWIARLREALRAVNAGQRLRTVHSEGYVLDTK